MPKTARLWHLAVAVFALVAALSLCALVAGSVASAVKEPVMLLWLLCIWALFYLLAVGFSGRWSEPHKPIGANGDSSLQLQEAGSGEDSTGKPLQVDITGSVEIGQVFHHDGSEHSALKPGLLCFENGLLHFKAEAEVKVDLAAGMKQVEDGYLCVMDDEVCDNPVYGKRDPLRAVRILHVQNLYESVVTFFMPMGPAKLTEAVVRAYVEQRTAELGQTRDLLLISVAEIVQAWSGNPKATIIIQACLSKLDPTPFTNPACLMSFELRLRNKLLDGYLGNPLLWTSACEVQQFDLGRTGSSDLDASEARAFYYDSFRFLVRLLQRDCPLPKLYPELATSLATWLLLREAAVAHFAGVMEAKLGETTGKHLKEVIVSYVGHYPEDEAMQDEHLAKLAYLLVSKGLLTAPAAFGELGYHEEHNILLILDAVKAHVANALEEKRLDRFAEKLFVDE